MTFELYLCNTLTVIMAAFFAIFSFLNAIARLDILGPFGARFVYEIEVIMGGLLGVPYYTLVEAAVFAIATFGTGKAIARPPPTDPWPAASLIIGTSYLCIVTCFAHNIGQTMRPFLLMTATSGGLCVWRIVRFTDTSIHASLLEIGLLSGSLSIAGCLRMMSRAAARAELNARFIRMQQFCDGQMDYDWVMWEDAPIGFMDSRSHISAPLISRS